MNPILSYFIEVFVTLGFCLGLFAFLHPFLKRILIDLCGTEDRATFWTAYSKVLLVGLPVLISLSYHPQAHGPEERFFELASRLSGNLIGFLLALIALGLIVTLFALFAPRSGGTS
jgi:tellurite resistance protein TehA-like permease